MLGRIYAYRDNGICNPLAELTSGREVRQYVGPTVEVEIVTPDKKVLEVCSRPAAYCKDAQGNPIPAGTYVDILPLIYFTGEDAPIGSTYCIGYSGGASYEAWEIKILPPGTDLEAYWKAMAAKV